MRSKSVSSLILSLIVVLILSILGACGTPSSSTSAEDTVDTPRIVGSWISDDGTALQFNEDGTGHIHVEVNYGNGLMGNDNDKDFKWKYDDSFESYLVDIGAVLTATIDEKDGIDYLSMAGVIFARVNSDNAEPNAE